jgi:hypothetical protein
MLQIQPRRADTLYNSGSPHSKCTCLVPCNSRLWMYPVTEPANSSCAIPTSTISTSLLVTPAICAHSKMCSACQLAPWAHKVQRKVSSWKAMGKRVLTECYSRPTRLCRCFWQHEQRNIEQSLVMVCGREIRVRNTLITHVSMPPHLRWCLRQEIWCSARTAKAPSRCLL